MWHVYVIAFAAMSPVIYPADGLTEPAYVQILSCSLYVINDNIVKSALLLQIGNWR